MDQTAYLVSGFVGLIFTVMLIAYVKFRPKLPVRVTCWFCNEVSTVPFGNKNCWDCPKCEQYNGFTKDGDYNKVIPAQYDNSLNHNIGCQPSEFLCFNKQLCDRCNNNHHLKARLLADFRPNNEANYDEEIKIHSKRLDNWYDICMDCQITVQQELQKQDAMLSRKLMSHDQQVPADSVSNDVVKEKTAVGKVRKYVLYQLIGTSCLLYMVFRCILVLMDNNIIDLDGTVLPGLPSDIELPWILIDNDVHIVIQIIGLLTTVTSKCILSKKYRLHPVDLGCVTLWIVILVLQCICSQWSSEIVYLYVNVANLVCSSYSVRRQIIPYGIKIRRFSFRQKNHNHQLNSTKKESKILSKSHVSGCLDDTLTELEAFTLGTTNKRQTNPGVFSSSFTSPEKTFTFPKQLSASRPLISPAKLNIMKFSQHQKQQREESPSFTQVKTPSKYSSDISQNSSSISTNNGLLSDKLASFPRFSSNDTDNISEKSGSSKSSVCPVDSTTKIDMEDDRGFIRKHIGIKEILYIAVLLASLGMNTYLTWYR